MSLRLKGTKNKNKNKGKPADVQVLSSFIEMNQIQSCPQGSLRLEGRSPYRQITDHVGLPAARGERKPRGFWGVPWRKVIASFPEDALSWMVKEQ